MVVPIEISSIGSNLDGSNLNKEKKKELVTIVNSDVKIINFPSRIFRYDVKQEAKTKASTIRIGNGAFTLYRNVGPWLTVTNYKLKKIIFLSKKKNW